MSRRETLSKLENLLETFLDQAVALKEDRLEVLGGINRLDDIARLALRGDDVIEPMGEWFAEHTNWLKESSLKPADVNRIGRILEKVRSEVLPGEDSLAARKIGSEINRWSTKPDSADQKIVLRRGPEEAITAPIVPSDESSIAMFDKQLARVSALWTDKSAPHEHILSVLDDSLKSALVQKNKEALILSAFIIYYLKQNRYLVEPYVKRLRQAEQLIKKERKDA